MKSYSKGKLNMKRLLGIFLIIVLMLLISIILSFFYVKNKNYFRYEKVDNSAMFVSDDVAKNSFPIVINNAVVGATYNDKWVSSARYENKSINKVGTELNLFSFDGMYGTFKIKEVKNISGNVIAYTDKLNYTNEYYGLKKDSIKYPVKVYNIDSNQNYIDMAKKALKKYKFLNDSIKINKIYSTTLNNKDNCYIINVTSDKKINNFGAYSAVIYCDDYQNSKIIKYNYVANTKDSEKFSVYDIKFIADLNSNGINDIIIAETDEFKTKYSVVEMKNNEFIEVLSCYIN